MAINILKTISERGVRAIFNSAMDKAPNVYQNHCLMVDSDKADEKHVWLGSPPIPTEFKGTYDEEAFNEFSLTLTNEEYILAYTIDLNTLERESEGQIQRRIQDTAEAYATLKDSQLADLLANGGTSTDTFDGVAFFGDARTYGLGTIDNNLTVNVDTPTAPDAPDIRLAMIENVRALREMPDDKGRVGFTASAMTQLRMIVPAEHEAGAVEAAESTIVSNSSNPWMEGLFAVDVLPYLTTATTHYLSAVGSPSKKPFIHQQETPLSVTAFTDQLELKRNHGLRVIAREKYKIGYGHPALIVKNILT